jgi:glycosyltransferase involved in cell wall biosynthesis
MSGLIIIPAYNEEKVIGKTLDDLLAFEGDWDIVVINDGSRDRTEEIVKEKGLRCVTLKINSGIGTAVQTGYKLARSEDRDWTLQFDADGQHRPDQIAALIEAASGEEACVVGSRYLGKEYKNTIYRRFGALYFSWLLRALGCSEVTDPSSGFRFCDRRATALFASNYPLDYPEVEARLMLGRRGLKVKEIPVFMKERQGGVSSINYFGALYYFAKVSLSLVLKGGR